MLITTLQPTTPLALPRDSKLTRLLEDALGGSARTALIACATPMPGFHLEQTRATLDFAARAARVVCTPQRTVVALEPPTQSPEQLAAMQTELDRLRNALATQTAECEALKARLGAGAASTLERLQSRLSFKRASSALLSLTTSGSWGGAASGLVDNEERIIGAGSKQMRVSCPGPALSGSSVWRMMQFSPAEGLGSLISTTMPHNTILNPTFGLFSSSGGSNRMSDGPSAGNQSEAQLRKWSTYSGHEGTLRRHVSLGAAPELASLSTVMRSEALMTGGSTRRVSEGDNSGFGLAAIPEARAAQAAQAARETSLREHIIRQMVQLLQQKKAEVRQLKEQLSELNAQLEAALEEGAAKDERIKQMVQGITKLGAARQEEVAKWSVSLAGLEASLVAAQNEGQAWRDEAASLQTQLAQATARYTQAAETLRRTSLVVLQTGHALSDAKVRLMYELPGLLC